MNFGEVLEHRIEHTRLTLKAKAVEYSHNTDRYHNFNVAARISNCTPEKALWGMAMKHLVSIIDIVDAVDRGEKVDLNMADEKIGDLVNYLILLDGLLKR